MRRSTIQKFTLTLAVVSWALLAGAQKSTGTNVIVYKAGQVWHYVGGDETITVLKVEDLPKIGRVIHVRVDNVPVPACPGFHLTRNIEHIALSEKMMRKSTADLERENEELPDSYFDEYRQWQKLKKPEVLKSQTVTDVIGRTADFPLICNFLPARTT